MTHNFLIYINKIKIMKNDMFLYFTTDNISGKKSNEKWLSINNVNLYNEIINWCNKFENLKNIEFKKKVYHYINDSIETPKCLTCNKNVKCNKCMKNSEEYYNKWLDTFKKNNSDKKGIIRRKKTCVDKYGSLENYNLILKNKIKNVIQKEYGVENVFQLKDIKNKSRKTKLNKYGDEYWNNKDKTREIRIRNGTQIDDSLIESFWKYKKIL